MADLKAEGGQDATNAIVEELEERKRELTRDAMDLWFQETTEWLNDAAQRRSQLGKRKGISARANQGLNQILKSAVPPTWVKEDDAWVFSFPHEGAVFQEFGARPHEIRAKKAEVLAFEWPDAPREVKKQFEHTEGDLVFFESISHPGVPAIGFVRYGRRRAEELLKEAGYEVEGFTE